MVFTKHCDINDGDDIVRRLFVAVSENKDYGIQD